MSEAITEAFESDAYEAAGEAEYEGEAFEAAEYAGEADFAGEAGSEGFSEDARSDARRRRERQRQIMLARRRQAQPRRRPSPPPRRPAAPGPRQAIAAIRSDVRDLNLDTKLDLDAVRRALDEANRRGDKAMYSALLSILANQALATYEPNLNNHQVVSAAIRWAPSLLLSSSKKRPGIEGFVLSPPVLAGAVVAGILISGHFINAPQGVRNIIVTVPSPLAVNSKFTGTPVDNNGAPVTGATVTWSSQNSSIIGVNSDGTISSLGTGKTQVAATVGKLTVWTPVEVEPSDPGNATQAVSNIIVSVPSPLAANSKLTGTPVDSSGASVPDATVTWSSADSSIVKVNSDGTVASVGTGKTQVAATVGNLTVWTRVKV